MAQKYDPTFPGWTIVRKLGEGSYGCVYELERRTEDGDVERAALKHISIPKDSSEINDLFAQHYDNETITDHFRDQMVDISKEYSIMESLRDNPYVVHCHELKTIQHDDGIGWDIFIRMDLLSPLKDNLSVDYDERQVIRLGLNMCGALASCHASNIIHRDIKPQNILVAPDGSFKLGDFGIAKISEKTSTQTMIGSPGYMAPEVANRQHYGAAADIYSLGMVMYWMMNEYVLPFLPLNKKIPSYDVQQKALDRRLSGEELPTPLNGSLELTRIVMRACSFNPKDRYQNAIEMAADLKKCIAPQRSNPHQPSASEMPSDVSTKTTAPQKTIRSNKKKHQNRNPTLWTIPLLLLLMIGSVAAFVGSKKVEPKKKENPQVVLTAVDELLTTNEVLSLQSKIEDVEKVEACNFISAQDNPSQWSCYLVYPTENASTEDIEKICVDLSQVPGTVWTMVFDKDIADDELWTRVEQEKGPFKIYCERLEELSGETIELYSGQKWLLHVKLFPENTTDEILFSSCDELIALVDQEGILTAISPGETEISIRCGTKEILTKIRVLTEPDVTAMTAGTPFRYFQNESGVTISGLQYCDFPSGELIIPSEIDGKPVTAIFDLQPPADTMQVSNLGLVESICIPDTVTDINFTVIPYLFPNIRKIDIADQNQFYSSLDGVLYNEDMTELLQVPAGKTGIYRIPDSVNSIDFRTFAECKKLEKIIVPNEFGEENLKQLPNRCLLQMGNQEYIIYGGNPMGSPQALLWIVLNHDNGKMLLLSSEAIACAPFHTSEETVTWKESTVRSWLNTYFLQNAFSESERAKIIEAKIITDSVTTQDSIFLLSQSEVEKYLPLASIRQASPSEYAKQTGAYTSEQGYCWWWLRSSGGNSNVYKAVVNDSGKIAQGYILNADDGAIRPAMWIEEASSPFTVEEMYSSLSYTESAERRNRYTYSQETDEEIIRMDIDHDGKDDVLFRKASGQEGQYEIRFANGSVFPIPLKDNFLYRNYFYFDDLDGSGKLDFVVQNVTSSTGGKVVCDYAVFLDAAVSGSNYQQYKLPQIALTMENLKNGFVHLSCPAYNYSENQILGVRSDGTDFDYFYGDGSNGKISSFQYRDIIADNGNVLLYCDFGTKVHAEQSVQPVGVKLAYLKSKNALEVVSMGSNLIRQYWLDVQ